MQHLQPNTTLQGGKYRIERVLGQGGFGITYLAIQTSLNRYVAIKELFIGGSGQAINERRGNQVVVSNSVNQQSFNQQKAKFKKEALRLANLNHPNLVMVHDMFEENGTAYYVMEYIDGESLRTKLNREGCLSEKLVMKYVQQILSALEIAHNQSIWHLDIKPENIMVDRHDHVYLIDFGASKHIEQNNTLATSLSLAYTRGFCPPELAELSYGCQEDLIQALKDIGPWTDIFSLGATIYNLLCDIIPPSSNRLYKDGRNAFVFSNNITSSTQDLIIWMMMPIKENRPQNVKDIIIYIKDKGLVESNEDTPVLMSEKISAYEETIFDSNDELLRYFSTNNIIINYDIIDSNLLHNLCKKYRKKIKSGEKICIEDISIETNKPIGIILIHLGWLMKEGKVDDSWDFYVKRNMTQITINFVGFSAGVVYQVLSTTAFPLSLEDIVKKAFEHSSTPIEGALLGFGWLFKEGKLEFVNNLIKLF